MNIGRVHICRSTAAIRQSKRFGKAPIASIGGFLVMSTSGIAMAQTAPAVPPQDPPSAVSQAPAARDSSAQQDLQDIVVTASKRSESVLRSPVAVTPITNVAIRQAGVVGLQDLNSVAPSLQVRNTGSFGAITFSIRGVSNADIFELANSPVATYIDGVFVGRPDALGGIIYDIDRIEVLRGPQGTLYGRNSTGGNVNIITAKPEQRFDASADLSYGNFNEVQARAMLNVPLSSTFAVRGAFAIRRNDGIYNTLGSTSRNYGAADEFSGRLSSLWEPGDRFKWQLVLEYYHGNGTPALDILTGPNGKPADAQPVYRRAVEKTEEPDLRVRNFSLRSRMDLKLAESTTVSYIAGYQDVKLKPQTMFGRDTLYRDTPLQAVNQEVDVSTDVGPLQNILGGNFYFQNYDADANSGIPALDLYIAPTTNIKTTAYGFFDQATFHATDALRLIGGIRYSSEKFKVSGSQALFCSLSALNGAPLRSLLGREPQVLAANPTACFNVPAVYGGGTSGTAGSHKVTWKAGLGYDFSPTTSGYATVSTGFKSAGLNLGGGLTADVARFGPEKVINYELGLKTRALNGRLTINADIYLMNYTDIQVTQLRAFNVNGKTSIANATTNAAGARNYGAELEYNWRIGEGTRISGFFNYIHATYTNYRNAIEEQSNAVIPSLDGNSLPYAPRLSVQGRLEHDFAFGNGATLTPKATFYWQSKSFIRAVNLPIDRIPNYHKTDLTLSYTDPSRRWTVEGFVYNLENRAIRNGGFVYVGDYLSSYNPPRTYGARISFKY